MNRLIISHQVILCFLLCFLLSCKSNDIPTKSVLTVSKKMLNFTNEAGSNKVRFETNIKEWEVMSSEPDWCKVTSKKQKNPYVLVYVEENKNIEARSCKLIISAENLSFEVDIRQLGSSPAIILSKDLLEFNSDEAIQEIILTTNLELIEFEVIPDVANWLTCVKSVKNDDLYIVSVKENNEFEQREAEIVFKSDYGVEKRVTQTLSVVQRKKTESPGDVEIPKDIKIRPTRGKANQAQVGQGIENTFDGKFGSQGNPYHSPWGDNTKLPVVLEYFFEDNPDLIDYLIYYTRNGNGNFGRFNLYVATAERPEYQLYGKYDFEMKSAPSKLIFNDGLKKPIKIKFEILSGYGGWVSCDEMEFYKRNNGNKLEAQLLHVFSDLTCSSLKKGVTDEDIRELPPFFGNIAFLLKQEKYETNFRIESYSAYSKVEEWADRLIINPRNVLDNPVGIFVEANEEIIVLVGNTYGNEIGLRCIEGTDYFGEDYFLHEGINKIKLRNKGLLYIMYNVSDLTHPSAKPIQVHIPEGCGIVNGYWDIKKHITNEKYSELLNKASYEFFEIKGTDIMLKFPTNSFKKYVPNKIIPSINFWDKMVQVEQSIMGWEGIYPDQMNNRTYARSTKEGYMSAQSYMTNFAENILYKILSPEKMLENEDNPWGPAHEIGHMNQGAINWIGNTETSNNLFSNLVRHKMTDFPTRGETIEENVQALMVEGRVFTTIGGDSPYEYGNIGYCSLRMNWQLYCYFHWLKNDEQFFPNVFKISRMDGRKPIHRNPGWSQLNFVKNACDAAKLNLIDFFDFWGFLRPVDINILQYEPAHLLVTDAMIAETINYIENKGYKKPKYPIQYIEDREGVKYGDVGKIRQFKEQRKITKNITHSMSGNRVSIVNGIEAVGFEVFVNKKKVFFSNKFQFTIPETIFDIDYQIYAVQSDGKKIIVK